MKKLSQNDDSFWAKFLANTVYIRVHVSVPNYCSTFGYKCIVVHCCAESPDRGESAIAQSHRERPRTAPQRWSERPDNFRRELNPWNEILFLIYSTCLPFFLFS